MGYEKAKADETNFELTVIGRGWDSKVRVFIWSLQGVSEIFWRKWGAFSKTNLHEGCAHLFSVLRKNVNFDLRKETSSLWFFKKCRIYICMTICITIVRIINFFSLGRARDTSKQTSSGTKLKNQNILSFCGFSSCKYSGGNLLKKDFKKKKKTRFWQRKKERF